MKLKEKNIFSSFIITTTLTTKTLNIATPPTINKIIPEQQVNQTGLLIVNTLGSLELHEYLSYEHSSAVKRLIIASIVIALISAMLVATIILFRCYMLYCQDHLNIRHYQRPPEQQQNKEDEESRFYANSNLSLLYYKIKEENNKELFNPIKLENKSRNENNNIKCCNYNNNNQKNIASNRYSFKSIFDDD